MSHALTRQQPVNQSEITWHLASEQPDSHEQHDESVTNGNIFSYSITIVLKKFKELEVTY